MFLGRVSGQKLFHMIKNRGVYKELSPTRKPLAFGHLRMSYINEQQPSCDHEENTRTTSDIPIQNAEMVKPLNLL